MARRIYVTKPMVEALEKALRRKDCPVCSQDWSYHAWLVVKGDKYVSTCSNVGKRLS